MAKGIDIVKKALEHKGESYVLGAVAALNDPFHHGPWDCSLAASWWLYQTAQIVYGCIGSNPRTADPYTGAWAEDARTRGNIIPINTAATIPGAYLLRVGQRIGHVVLVQGKKIRGTWITIEAMGSAYGVREGIIDGRRWDMGILIPGVTYEQEGQAVITAPTQIYRLTSPRMKGDMVREIQRALAAAGHDPGAADGIFGADTANAAISFQKAHGLVVDGEVGPQTLSALGL